MLVKAISVPSGDHAGCESGAALFVRSVTSPPSTPITNTSRLPVRSDVKAMWAPSADQAGSVSELASLVMSSCPLPSGFIVKISLSPVRSDRKARSPFPRGRRDGLPAFQLAASLLDMDVVTNAGDPRGAVLSAISSAKPERRLVTRHARPAGITMACGLFARPGHLT